MNENAFIARHTHFCFLLRNLYWTVGMGVRLFMAAKGGGGGRGRGERGGRSEEEGGRRDGGRGSGLCTVCSEME